MKDPNDLGRRLGHPTKQAHTERRAVAYRARRKRPPEPVTPARADTLAAWQAQLDWERQEHLRLRNWLAAYGSVLLDPWGPPQGYVSRVPMVD